MIEFNTPITPEQSAFLAANKADLCQKDSGKAVWQNRVKMASEAFDIAKGIHAQHSLTSLVAKTSEDEDDDVDETFPDWPTFRDNFILDWIGSRTVVTEQEADMIFERTADEALQAIEQAEQNGTLSTEPVVDTSAPVVETPAPAASEPVVATKRRGRPPGSGKKTATAVVKAAKKTGRRKVAAKKKSVGSASAKAQTIIEKYAAREWSRKDIIQKLQDQLGMGAAYASTLYQKYS